MTNDDDFLTPTEGSPSWIAELRRRCPTPEETDALCDRAERLAVIDRQVLWRTEDMPPDAVAWWKRTWGNGEMECRYMNEDGDELHPEAPDHLPDDPVGPLFLPILDPPEQP